MTGGLTCPSRKTSVAGPSLVCHHARLQVPDAVYNRQRLRLNGRQLTEEKCFAERPKKMPLRSVSFRENEATKIERKRLARSRPGSLRAQSDYYCRSDAMRPERASFRLPRRHLSVREGRLRAEPEAATPIAQRTVRIPASFSRKISRSKSLHVRSASLSNEAARSIRSRLSKIIRAKSSAGDPSSSEPIESKASIGETQPDANYGGLIDICVIQATPAASPCASIRSTFSGDSIELGLKPPPANPGASIKTSMSVRDRRRCFANMKAETIDRDHETVIDRAYLAPPASDFQMTSTSSGRLASPRHLASSLHEVFNHHHHQQQQQDSSRGKCLAKSSGSSKSLSADLCNSPMGSSFD